MRGEEGIYGKQIFKKPYLNARYSNFPRGGSAIFLRGKAASQTNLTVWADLLEDLPDLGLEAHVQHAVSLVQAEVGDPLQVHLAHLQEVDQPPGCRDHDLAPVLDVPQLRALGSSAEHAGVLHARGLPELVGNLLDLLGKLPGNINYMQT